MSLNPTYRPRQDSDSVVAVLASEVNNLKKQADDTDEAIGALTAEVSGLRVDIARLTTTISQVQVKPKETEGSDNTKLIVLLSASFGIMQALVEVIKALIHH